ncbi:hypothetical protein ACJZ2D_005232 [Fusarium nematophilum]
MHLKDIQAVAESLFWPLNPERLPLRTKPEMDAFVKLAMIALPFQEAIYPALRDIISMLVAGGIDPNARIHYTKSEVASPFCIVAKLVSASAYTAAELAMLRVDRLLVENGCDISKIMDKSTEDPRFVGLFQRNPSFLPDQGQSLVRTAVVQRSEEELLRHLDVGGLNFQAEGASTIALAVGWQPGLEILLRYGFNPSTAIFTAVTQHDIHSLEMLLNLGCPMFLDPSKPDLRPVRDCTNIFQFALDVKASQHIMTVLINTLAKRRRQLHTLAVQHLPLHWLRRLGITSDRVCSRLLDHRALEVYLCLRDHGIEVPASLRPGKSVTMYHLKNITVALAEELFQAGFQDIDISDDEGTTPLCKCTTSFHRNRLELAMWFLERGANPYRTPASLSGRSLHAAAENFYGFFCSADLDYEARSKPNIVTILDHFRDVDDLKNPDKCSCLCSAAGCRPSAIILKRLIAGTAERQRYLFLLPMLDPSEMGLSDEAFVDICRLEVFDRLGLIHTCKPSRSYSWLDVHTKKRTKARALRTGPKPAIETYVAFYRALADIHRHSFHRFWVAWWCAIATVLPAEQPWWSYRYSPLPITELISKYGGPETEEMFPAADKELGFDDIAAAVNRTLFRLDEATLGDFCSAITSLEERERCEDSSNVEVYWRYWTEV